MEVEGLEFHIVDSETGRLVASFCSPTLMEVAFEAFLKSELLELTSNLSVVYPKRVQ